MINNRQQNGRRRGRGGNGSGGGGGGGQRQGGGGQGPRDSGNRIDSRARGNASQLLEKYRNMARDAQLSGDRVQTEYYLQFADHYFRVLADQRGRFDDGRGDQQRRGREDFDQFDDGDDFGDEMDTQADTRTDTRADNRGRADEGQRSSGNANCNGAEGGERTERADRAERTDRAPRASAANDEDESAEAPAEGRRGRRSRRPERNETPVVAASEEADPGIADRLPPSFGFAVEGERATEGEPAEEAPRPRRRRARAAGEAPQAS